LPTLCAASQWNSTPASRAMWPIAAIGCSVPISLLACMIEISTVRGVSARRTASGSTLPCASTGSTVTVARPAFSSALQESSTALCSVAAVMT
jgi:hypothetical protein